MMMPPNLAMSRDLSAASLIHVSEDPPAVFNVVVGLHIREIEFDDSSQRAFFITDDGISIADMADVSQDQFIAFIGVSDDPLEDAQAVDREVEITGDGRFALVRTQ
jgi:hypothetical protein